MARNTNGTALRVIREHVGFKQRELAARCEITAAYLCQIETGARQPPMTMLVRIAGVLGVPVDAISYPVCEHELKQVAAS